MEAEEFNYKVRCRGCSKTTVMFFGRNSNPDALKLFHRWVKEHSTFPIQKQCTCDNGSMLFHDIISYSPFI